MSRQAIHYHIHYLVENGYLRLKNPNESFKQYYATDKIYNLHMESKKVERQGRKLCRVHCIGYICEITQPPTVKIHWEKVFKNNGTIYQDLHWNTDLGRATIRMITSHNISKVIFWLPEKYLDDEQLAHWKKIEERYAETFYDEFKKRYDCRLGELSRYQKQEFAFQEDSEFLFLADKYNLKSGNSWVDESEGSPEWETNDYELAKAKIELPERLLRLENNVERLVKGFSRIEVSLKKFDELFSQPKLPDEKRDVA